MTNEGLLNSNPKCFNSQSPLLRIVIAATGFYIKGGEGFGRFNSQSPLLRIVIAGCRNPCDV